MNTTTNYGLKLYEGTDLFNPLTVENVNAGDIDTAMKAISDHSVGAATELTTGTVHALTRADADRNVFLFVATSNFTAGDTFTLDGTQVSALTPDGQPLATGSYVIGSSVLCALHDTLITVYVNPAKAKDADMLDGHDSSYYATDSDLDTVAGTIQAVSDKVGTAVLTTTAPDCSGAINELNTHFTDLTKAQKYDEWEDVTSQCVLDRSITWGACTVKDNGYKYRITFTVGLSTSTLTTRLTLPKNTVERCILPMIGDNGAGTPVNAVGNVTCMNSKVVQMSSTGAAYFSQTFDVYHE